MGQVVSFHPNALHDEQKDNLDAARSTLRNSVASLAKLVSNLESLPTSNAAQALIHDATTLILKIEKLDLGSKSIKADLTNVLELASAFNASCTAWSHSQQH